eukprot:TRINITY_DN191_c0_g1_i5.p1 TRINITY_DN191_c0_g1~~TRINITY_DN191_c0_g1_i5.p1  ORF type:complete len:111 (+),score=20.91 TRINITY_DN191_c0_g1_i5:304-636(+)
MTAICTCEVRWEERKFSLKERNDFLNNFKPTCERELQNFEDCRVLSPISLAITLHRRETSLVAIRESHSELLHIAERAKLREEKGWVDVEFPAPTVEDYLLGKRKNAALN